MTIVKNVKTISLLMTVFISIAQADIITFPSNKIGTILDASKIAFGGNGCSQASVRITSINDKAAILSHGNLSGSLEGSNLVRKNCTVRIPISVQEGYQVALQAASSGKVELGDNDTLTTNRELFVASSTGKVQTRVYEGELNQRLQLLEQPESKLSFTNCGEDSILAMNLSALLRGNGRALKDSSFSLNKTVFRLIVRKCK